MEPTRVLHVDEDSIQRALMVRYLGMLKEHEYAVIFVESKEDAVEMFRRGGVDLVILDYQLAQGDGLNCLRELRQLDPIVPVIAVSNIATPEIAAELIEAGADDYLSKQSLDVLILAESIDAALARARGIRAMAGTSAPLEGNLP